MSEPTDAGLRSRYRPRLLSEAADLRAASGGTTADRKPAKLDQQSVGRLSRMDAMQRQAMAANSAGAPIAARSSAPSAWTLTQR